MHAQNLTGVVCHNASRYVSFLLLAGLSILDCSQKNQQQQQQLQLQKTEQVQPGEQSETLTEAQYSHLLGDLLSIEEKIKQAPDNSALRSELLDLAIRRGEKKIYAAGMGLVPEQAPSPGVAAQNAERAALVDASRWIAYGLEWNKHLDQPVFGSLQAQVPPVKIVYKNVSPEQVVVLVAADLP